MNGHINFKNKTVYRIVLTGGPCGGKTTAQARLSDFFENLGWRVYRVPEAANLLLSGGVKFSELDAEQVQCFQEDLLKTLLQVEDTFFRMAERSDKNTLVICDRGAMDPSAYCPKSDWNDILRRNSLVHETLRDQRYHQVVHLVTAAAGAESFYTLENSTCRDEGFEHARRLDAATSNAWVGHPYFDVIDNSSSFDEKVLRVKASVVNRLNIEVGGDRLSATSRKRKFLIEIMPEDKLFEGNYQDFTVVHTYLDTHSVDLHTRVRKRGSKGSRNFTYLQTTRKIIANGDTVELKRQLSEREYSSMQLQRDPTHYRIYKIRRCFLWNNQYFQLDYYQTIDGMPAVFKDLIILETYTTTVVGEIPLPPFLKVAKEITHDKTYSMFNMSKAKDAAEALAPRTRGRLRSQPNLDQLNNFMTVDGEERMDMQHASTAAGAAANGGGGHEHEHLVNGINSNGTVHATNCGTANGTPERHKSCFTRRRDVVMNGNCTNGGSNGHHNFNQQKILQDLVSASHNNNNNGTSAAAVAAAAAATPVVMTSGDNNLTAPLFLGRSISGEPGGMPVVVNGECCGGVGVGVAATTKDKNCCEVVQCDNNKNTNRTTTTTTNAATVDECSISKSGTF